MKINICQYYNKIKSMDYIIKDDTIIFSPEFDKPLDSIGLIDIYKKIIFSNYELCEDLFEAYEKINIDCLEWKVSQFNQPLLDSLNQLVNLTHLGLGYNFNQKEYFFKI